MTSYFRSYALSDSNNVTLTGGNGSDSSTNIAKACIDIRSSNIFVVDISELADNWNILFQGPLREAESSNEMNAEGDPVQPSDPVSEPVQPSDPVSEPGSAPVRDITIVCRGITSGLRAGNAYFSNDLCPTVDGAGGIKISILFNEYTDTSALRFVCIGDNIVSFISK